MSKKTKMIVILSLLAAIIVGIGLFITLRYLIRPTVNLNDFVTIKCNGEDGKGRVTTLILDYEALAEKYGYRAKHGYYYEAKDRYYFFIYPNEAPDYTGSVALSYTADNKEDAAERAFRTTGLRLFVQGQDRSILGYYAVDLSNGDIIEITWTPSDATEDKIEQLETLFNINIEYDDFSYRVKGLD